MSIEIYPSDFSTRYGISHALSISMSVYYNEVGKIQLNVFADDYNISALKVGSVVYDTERGTSYIIVNTKFDADNNTITANGYTSDWLLNSRCVASEKSIGVIETGCYELINANLRSLPRISTATVKGLTERYKTDDTKTAEDDESAVYGGQLLDAVESVLDYGELGRRMNWNGDTLAWTFEIYKGEDLTDGIHRVAFVEEQGTCSDLVINNDNSTFKNVAYVDWTYDETPQLTVIGEATGANRREVWLKSGISPQQDETSEYCEKRVLDYGRREIANYIARESFQISVDGSELGDRYNLGDVVTCVSNRFAVSFNARITGIKYKLDANGEKTEIVLGDPILTALGELKLNG